VAEAREAALGELPLATLPLAAPFEDVTLVATAVGEDPVAKASWRNRALYVVLLGIFYITLALGIAFTGRTLYREARLSRLKTDFVSLVSHELRTPMTSIRMFIEMLASKRIRDEDEMRTVMDLLTKETTRLSALIESVLDFSRLEGGKVRYQLVPSSAKAVATRALDAFVAQHLGENEHLQVDVPEGLNFLADEEAISGALLNLLQNAYKYSAANRLIELKASRVDREVVLEVRDNGVGIARREHRRIFERFYRVDDLLTRQTQGTGLGLSIAQRIVQAHKGRISLDSAVGKGSTFRIHLPAL
jgi:two-component system, OmpR family, phosphate regulon sensor histidine kinase PhoR